MFKKLRREFLHLNIAKKILLGYIPVIAITILIGFYSLINLTKLNALNEEIIRVDIPIGQITDHMIETIFNQELFGRRHVIMKSENMKQLYFEKQKLFVFYVNEISKLLASKNKNAEKLRQEHEEYNQLFSDWFFILQNEYGETKDYDSLVRQKQKDVVAEIREISKIAKNDQNQKVIYTSKISMSAFRMVAIFCLLCIISGVLTAMLITRNISRAIHRLRSSTEEISLGNFDHNPIIHSRDELGDLSQAFKQMAKRLKKLEELNLEASPLTQLPGGLSIENQLKFRISKNEIFAFCLIDLDNFKVFNDRYGYARGNEVIRAVAKLLQTTSMQYGGKNNFIGHIGGDDFVLICSDSLVEEMCQFVIKTFDEKVTHFYDAKDLDKGFIIGKNRQGEEKSFPVMTISIAVIINDLQVINHHLQISERAAELKEYVKSIPGSSFVVDRRK